MRTTYFSIYDKKALVFSPVFPAPTIGAAERMFSDSVNGAESHLSKYPEDFALYEMFPFDDERGVVITTEDADYGPPQPRLVVEATQVKKDS